MANRNGNGPDVGAPALPLSGLTPEVWAAACSDIGYHMVDGCPVLGISADAGDGYLVKIAAPVSIDPVNLARALLSHALRVGQSGLKACFDKNDNPLAGDAGPSQEAAQKATDRALNGAYKPSRERDLDLVRKEAEGRYFGLVKAAVLRADPTATEADIAETHRKMAASDAGKAKVESLVSEVLSAGTYAVARNKKATTGKVIAVELE